jgi:putative transposase
VKILLLNHQNKKTIHGRIDFRHLKKQETGIPAKEICREYGISEVTFYNWKSKYGGMEASDVKQLKDLEEESSRLKRMFAQLSMDHAILKNVISKKG